MNTKRKNLFQHEETHLAARGVFSSAFRRASGGSAEILRARCLHQNFQNARRLVHENQGDDLQKLKTFLALGRVEQAKKIFSRLGPSAHLADEFGVELKLQEIRIAYFEGDWSQVAQMASHLEANAELPALSEMCLVQLRANALYELGEFRKSSKDTERLFEMQTLFPHSLLGWYSRTNQIRMDLRQGNPVFAAECEKNLWASWARNPEPNLDLILTLLRSRIDFLRHSKSVHIQEARASWLVARALGDELYEGLAFFDYCVAIGLGRLSRGHRERLDAYRAEHPRLERLWCEVAGQADSISETARTIAAYIAVQESNEQADSCTDSSDLIEEADEILFLNLGIKVRLSNRSAQVLRIQSRPKDVIRVLARGKQSRSELFRRVWNQRYARDLHDPLLRVLMGRVRKQIGAPVLSQGGQIEISPRVVVLSI